MRRVRDEGDGGQDNGGHRREAEEQEADHGPLGRRGVTGDGSDSSLKAANEFWGLFLQMPSYQAEKFFRMAYKGKPV